MFWKLFEAIANAAQLLQMPWTKINVCNLKSIRPYLEINRGWKIRVWKLFVAIARALLLSIQHYLVLLYPNIWVIYTRKFWPFIPQYLRHAYRQDTRNGHLKAGSNLPVREWNGFGAGWNRIKWWEAQLKSEPKNTLNFGYGRPKKNKFGVWKAKRYPKFWVSL